MKQLMIPAVILGLALPLSGMASALVKHESVPTDCSTQLENNIRSAASTVSMLSITGHCTYSKATNSASCGYTPSSSIITNLTESEVQPYLKDLNAALGDKFPQLATNTYGDNKVGIQLKAGSVSCANF